MSPNLSPMLLPTFQEQAGDIHVVIGDLPVGKISLDRGWRVDTIVTHSPFGMPGLPQDARTCKQWFVNALVENDGKCLGVRENNAYKAMVGSLQVATIVRCSNELAGFWVWTFETSAMDHPTFDSPKAAMAYLRERMEQQFDPRCVQVGYAERYSTQPSRFEHRGTGRFPFVYAIQTPDTDHPSLYNIQDPDRWLEATIQKTVQRGRNQIPQRHRGFRAAFPRFCDDRQVLQVELWLDESQPDDPCWLLSHSEGSSYYRLAAEVNASKEDLVRLALTMPCHELNTIPTWVRRNWIPVPPLVKA